MKKSSRSVKATRLLCSIQGTATRHITEGVRGTAFDMLEVHVNIPPIDLLFWKVQFCAASRIAALPPHHPLFPLAWKMASCFVKLHRSPYTISFSPQVLSPILQRPSHLHPATAPHTSQCLKQPSVQIKKKHLKMQESHMASQDTRYIVMGQAFRKGQVQPWYSTKTT